MLFVSADTLIPGSLYNTGHKTWNLITFLVFLHAQNLACCLTFKGLSRNAVLSNGACRPSCSGLLIYLVAVPESCLRHTYSS